MGVDTLQSFVEGGHMEGVAENVDLMHVARLVQQRHNKFAKGKQVGKKLCLVLDAECCFDRLYGGYFSDWTCGGQWNRMIQFLNQLINACKKGNIELTVAFNGTLDRKRMPEWIQLQMSTRQKIQNVQRHLHNKGTPPPKVWWVPPPCLSTALRLALRYLNVPMISSVHHHQQEVLTYCRSNNFHGIVGDDAEYLVFDPPRYFSASSLKLTFKGSLETREYLVKKVAEGLGLDTQRFCILTALLGNHFLTEAQLTQLYGRLKANTVNEQHEIIPILANYVKNLENADNLDKVAIEIFGADDDERCRGLVESVQYYLKGNPVAYIKCLAARTVKSNGVKDDEQVVPTHQASFASETGDNENGNLETFAQLSDQHKPSQFLLDEKDEGCIRPSSSMIPNAINGISEMVNGTNGNGSVSPPVDIKQNANEEGRMKNCRVHPEVLRTAALRHQNGVMSPLIYQILTQGEIKLPVILEDEHLREVPNVHSIYLPVRQSIYAILFNVHHQMYLAKKEQGDDNAPFEMPSVKEWTFPYNEPNIVKAEPIGWSIPTIQRLWFGNNLEDMRRRLRAFLTCMRSDNSLMVSVAYVPQHMLIMASVLRYLMQAPVPVLRPPELDAFLVTAFYPNLTDSDFTQEIQLQKVTTRGTHLANMFMQGVEYAILANEACGAPLAYLMCSPWLYFDGKLFHHLLTKSEYVKSLQELCNHRMEILVKVERMRHAILENLHIQYARRPYGTNLPNPILPYPPGGLVPPGYNPATAAPPQPPPERRGQRRAVSARGGQLEVAGVVVCSWGPNYSFARERNQAFNGVRGPVQKFGDRPAFSAQNNAHAAGAVFPARRRINSNRRPKGKKQEKKNWTRASNEATPRQADPSTSGSSAEESNTEETAQVNDMPTTSDDKA